MSSVTYRVEGDIAILEVNNPPVNALSYAVRSGLKNHIQRCQNDDKVHSIVLLGHRVFIGGADIREFGMPMKDPSLTEVVGILEDSKKPIVAAISGFALGGGFEVAISCHYRIANEKAVFGFPEVDLGILPAATGTQRFTRLVGLKASLDLIPTGRRIGAKEALSVSAIDKIVSGDLVKEAIQYAKSVAGKPFENRRVSRMKVKDAHNAIELRDAAVRRAAQKMRGQLSPLFCIKAVMAAAEFPFEQGSEKEREYASVLFSSSQSRALQYAFFSERSATKWDVPGVGNHKTSKPLPLKTGAVIGAGIMGTGITMTLLNAGMPVTLVEQNEEQLKKGVSMLKNLYAGSVKLKRLSEQQAKSILSQLKPTVRYEDIKDADIVVEAVYENMAIKKEIFKKMDTFCKPSAILASNTSTLDIDQMADVTRRPDKVIGTHFFVPAYYMRLLENVRGAKTSAETIATAQAFGAKIGKISVLVGNCNGFAANRMRGPMVAEAVFLVEEGCTPEEVDQVAEDFGIPLGPLKVSDLSGLDIGAAITNEKLKKIGKTMTEDTSAINGERVSALGYMLAKQGRYGRKTGAGFYRYEAPNAKEPFTDPWLLNFLEKFRAERGINPRKISPQEIQERMLFSTINEGFKILEEGICRMPEEIDTLWLHGFGWPRYMGGPMFYASMIGLDRLYDRICYYYDQNPMSRHWQPSDLLRRLAKNNVPFKQWSQHIRPVTSQL